MLVVRDGREKGRGREYKGERGERTEGETETSNPLVHSPMATAVTSGQGKARSQTLYMDF